MDRKELRKRYNSGEINFRGIDLSGANLHSIILLGCDMSNAILSHANLSKANLRIILLIGANLRHANLTGADLSDANLTGADLTGADLRGANLTGAVLIETNLNGADLTGTQTKDVLFCRTIMPYGAIKSDPIRVVSTQDFLKRYATGERRFPGIVLHRADLRGQDLRGINLAHREVIDKLKYPAFLIDANLSGANLEECSLVGVKFRGANLSGANLYRAILTGVDFSYANLSGVNLLYADMEGVDFTGADLTGANVDEPSLYWGTFFCNTILPNGEVIVAPTSYGD